MTGIRNSFVGTSRILALGIILLATVVAAEAKSRNAFGIDISNFGQINDRYYRGAQPDEQGFRQLSRLGVNTVIDLQEDPDSREAGWVREAGMKYVNIPLSDSRPATDEETASFLRLVNDPATGTVYVHCRGGRHRTGEMTALFRMTHDSWTADQAYQEMKKFDYYSRWGHGALKDYVFDYYGRMKSGSISDPAARLVEAK